MRDKQIEEMEKIIQPFFDYCWVKDWFPNGDEIAEMVYDKGYRKASDVAKEILAKIKKEIELALDNNYKVKRDAQDMNDTLVIYVEGKIDCLRGLLGFIDELKEEYESEGEG